MAGSDPPQLAHSEYASVQASDRPVFHSIIDGVQPARVSPARSNRITAATNPAISDPWLIVFGFWCSAHTTNTKTM